MKGYAKNMEEAAFNELDNLYRRLITIDDYALKLDREVDKPAIKAALIAYITSFGLSFIKDIYLQNTNSPGYLFSIRCLIEGIAVFLYSEKIELSAEKEAVFKLQAYDIEKKIYNHYPMFDKDIIDLATITNNFNTTKAEVSQKHNLSSTRIKKILKSKIPALGDIDSFESLINDYLGADFARFYKIISLYVHPYHYCLENPDLFKQYSQKALDILQTFFADETPAKEGLEKEYNKRIHLNEYGKRLRSLTHLQNDKLKELCKMIAYAELDFLSFSLKNCRRIMFDYFLDITMGNIEQSTTKWKSGIENLWMLNYCLSDENLLRSNVIHCYHSKIKNTLNDGRVVPEEKYAEAYSVYKNKYPNGCDFVKFIDSFTRTTGYTINEQGETISLTTAVFSLIDELAPSINGGKMPAIVKDGPYETRTEEDHKNTKDFDIASFLKMKYEESQAMSHATGYLYYSNSGAWHDGYILAYFYEELFQLLLAKELDNLKALYKNKKSTKTIVNFLRNFIEKNKEYIVAKRAIYFGPRVPKD